MILEHQTGSINVSAKTFSDGYPARFYLNGKLMGKPPLTLEDVTAGTHAYRFEADNHQEVLGKVIVNLDEKVKLDKSLKPLPGHLSLKSIPSGAVIWVDGKMSKLKTDVKAKISAGKHTITLKIDQYVDAEKDIDILPGSVLEETFQLVKDRGKINVVSIPEGAAIWIGGEDTGKRTDHLMKVLHGEHEITIKLDGYKDALKKVRLEPEGFTEVEFRLEKGSNVPLPGSIFTDPITGMEFVYVPGGKFMMGDIFGDDEEDEEEEMETPVHEVELGGFYIGKYSVTQGEWEAVMGDNPSSYKEGDRYPVDEVSWNDAQEFFKKLISKNNKRYQFRLPTEAEWEYAARSGGKKEKYAGSNDVDAVAWYDENSAKNPHPVGKKLPNGLGIYDMSGNVYEWCQDWYGDYPSGSVTNPTGPSSGSSRVLRGGGWYDYAERCRSADRGGYDPGNRDNSGLGFRLAFDFSEKQSKINEELEDINDSDEGTMISLHNNWRRDPREYMSEEKYAEEREIAKEIMESIESGNPTEEALEVLEMLRDLPPEKRKEIPDDMLKKFGL